MDITDSQIVGAHKITRDKGEWLGRRGVQITARKTRKVLGERVTVTRFDSGEVEFSHISGDGRMADYREFDRKTVMGATDADIVAYINEKLAV